jgi:hypothetical protein
LTSKGKVKYHISQNKDWVTIRFCPCLKMLIKIFGWDWIMGSTALTSY